MWATSGEGMMFNDHLNGERSLNMRNFPLAFASDIAILISFQIRSST